LNKWPVFKKNDDIPDICVIRWGKKYTSCDLPERGDIADVA